MSLTSLLTETFWILPYLQGGVDEYNNPTDTYDDAVQVKGRLEQQTADEHLTDRDTPVSEWLLYLHPNAVITSFDRVQDADGRMFEVAGTPQVNAAPRGSHHIAVRLRLVEHDLEAAVT